MRTRSYHVYSTALVYLTPLHPPDDVVSYTDSYERL